VAKHAVVEVQPGDMVHDDETEKTGRDSHRQNDDETAILLEIYRDVEVVTLRQMIPS
jgi:hypothetical protein